MPASATQPRGSPAHLHRLLAGAIVLFLPPLFGPAALAQAGSLAGGAGAMAQASAPAAPAPAEVVITEDGVGRMRILVSGLSSNPAATSGQEAADPGRDLQACLRRISGAELELAAAEPGNTGLYLGKAADFPWLGLEAEVRDLGPEGFLIRSDGTNLLLLAREDPGVPHAAVTFLHLLGCRWFFPGEAWEVVPVRPTIRGAWNERQSPSFDIQRHLSYGFGAYPKNAADKRAWDRRNRLGSAMPVSIGHAGHGLSQADFERNPDLFALREGKRVAGSKPCYSHPEYIRRAVSNVLQRAAGGARMISMTPADGLGYCECARCREWAQGGKVYWDQGSQFAKRPDGTLVCITSESLFACINAAARALRESGSGALIGTYAYSAYSHPPSFAIESNVFIQTTTAYRRTPMSLEDQLRTFKAMGVQSGIRAYWSVYQWDWDYPAVTGELALPRLANDLRFYHANGARSLNTEMSCNWAPRGLGYYLGARLLWNVNEDPKALLADFYDRAFGPAAKPMERYYARWLGDGARVSAATSAPPPGAKGFGGILKTIGTAMDELGSNEAGPEGFSRKTLREACRDLDEAARLAGARPDCLARINHLRLYAHYLCLRIRLDETPARDRDALLQAMEAETVFGARLMDSNMIHARPLIGKAFHRRFRKYAELLKGRPEWPEDPTQGWNKGFRVPRHDVPTPDELAELWAADQAFLGF